MHGSSPPKRAISFECHRNRRQHALRVPAIAAALLAAGAGAFLVSTPGQALRVRAQGGTGGQGGASDGCRALPCALDLHVTTTRNSAAPPDLAHRTSSAPCTALMAQTSSALPFRTTTQPHCINYPTRPQASLVAGPLGSSGCLAAFSLISLSEIGDKTFFISAVLAARIGRALSFAGSLAALVLLTVGGWQSAGGGWGGVGWIGLRKW